MNSTMQEIYAQEIFGTGIQESTAEKCNWDASTYNAVMKCI